MKGASAADQPPTRGPWYRLVQIGLVVAIFAVIHWWRAEPLATGDAPPLTGQLLADNSPFDLEQLRGRPVLVHFWATWCPVCRLGDDAIEAIAADFPVITVAMQSGSRADITRHMSEEGLSFPVLPDSYGELASRWGVQGVPTSFVLDSGGGIRFSAVGLTTEVGLRARLWAANNLD